MAVYHYVTRSREDFEAKSRRGGGAGVGRPLKFFDDFNAHATLECTAAKRAAVEFATACPALVALTNAGP